jgi:hypothetical protein
MLNVFVLVLFVSVGSGSLFGSHLVVELFPALPLLLGEELSSSTSLALEESALLCAAHQAVVSIPFSSFHLNCENDLLRKAISSAVRKKGSQLISSSKDASIVHASLFEGKNGVLIVELKTNEIVWRGECQVNIILK